MTKRRGEGRLLAAMARVESQACPSCKVAGVVRTEGGESFIECPQCGRKIASAVIKS